jgi:hypothetical protein
MGNERDVFEWRRFGHWTSSAEKAWFAAYLFWHMRDQAKLKEVIRECDYKNGDGDLAVIEAFRRESGVALELIIKAVIARSMEARRADPAIEGVPANHDIPSLWSQANLPDLPREDKYRLLLVKQTLMWSGRYATPRTVKAWEEENKMFDTLEDPPTVPGKFVIRNPITISWSDFDRLYQTAKANLSQHSDAT